jgi:hypothetical protein
LPKSPVRRDLHYRSVIILLLERLGPGTDGPPGPGRRPVAPAA